QRLFRHYDPTDDVGDQSGAGRDEAQNQPDDADECDVDVEVFGDAGANAADFAAGAGAHQAFAAGDGTYTFAAVGTDIGIFLDHLAAVVTVHTRLLVFCYAGFDQLVP